MYLLPIIHRQQYVFISYATRLSNEFLNYILVS